MGGKKKKKGRGRECEERERDLPDQCQTASYAPESDSVCAHLQLLVYWPVVRPMKCIFHFSMRQIINAFCSTFSSKFRKMRFFLAKKVLSDVIGYTERWP